jgi:hypothetical protein
MITIFIRQSTFQINHNNYFHTSVSISKFDVILTWRGMSVCIRHFNYLPSIYKNTRNVLFFRFFFLMRRVQSLEFNNNSYSSLSHQTKKVSLPPETNFAPKSSYGWLRRSAPNINARTTVVPITVVQEEIPNYFGSTMQSMCLAFFTLAYTEVDFLMTKKKVYSFEVVNRWCGFFW